MNDSANRVVDRVGEGVFGVSRRVFTDPALLELEFERVFEGGWVYLGHESQFPAPGDYLTTTIGRRSILLTRAAGGAMHAFLNACAHRGSALCRSERGSKKLFVCPYHGWSYDAEGRNVHVKARESGGYSKQFDSRSHDLAPLARLDSYRGFVFGSLAERVEPLGTYLGAAAPFIDLLVDQSPDGLEVLPGGATYRYRGNWKLQAENGIDGYHFTTVHQNYVNVLQRRGARAKRDGESGQVRSGFDARAWGTEAGWYDFGNGHAAIWLVSTEPESRPLWEQRDALAGRVGKERADWMVRRQRNLMLFPNVQLMDQNSTQIRVIRPISADLTEVKSYCFAPRGEPPAARARRIRQFEDFFNASGLATPDDLAVFENVQAGCRADPQRIQGYDRGMARIRNGADEAARGLGFEPFASGGDVQDEALFHGMYRQWAKMMGPATP